MELQLELALSTGSGLGSDPNQDCGNKMRKRCFDAAFLGVEKNVDESSRNGEVINVDLRVGWPPVKSSRKQFLHHHNRRGSAVNYVNVENSGGGGLIDSKYVKVKMQGVGITRKLDLSTHNSYQTLVANLVNLFGKCVEKYKLIYQNKEGDWLHAKYDVPWEIFMNSVQRLKLERNGYGL